MTEKYFKDTIWTNHALQRLADRRITQSLVYKTFSNPDKKTQVDNDAFEYQKQFGIYKVTAIIKKVDNGWLVISCWMDPPLKGTEDAKKKTRYLKYKHGGLFTRLYLIISRELFGKDF